MKTGHRDKEKEMGARAIGQDSSSDSSPEGQVNAVVCQKSADDNPDAESQLRPTLSGLQGRRRPPSGTARRIIWADLRR